MMDRILTLILLATVLSSHGKVVSKSGLDEVECEDSGTYIVRDLYDCGRFLHCHEGKRDIMVCHGETHYSVTLERCVWSHMSDCTPRKAGETSSSRILTSQRFTLTKPMDFVVDGDPEHSESLAETISSSEFRAGESCWHGETKADLGDCSKFLICNRGRFQQFSCSNDQVYDREGANFLCVDPEHSSREECRRRKQSQSEGVVHLSSQSGPTQITSEGPSEKAYSEEVSTSEVSGADTYFRDYSHMFLTPSNDTRSAGRCETEGALLGLRNECGGYAVCVFGQAVGQTCPYGTLFDPAVHKRSCIWPSDATRPDCHKI